MKQLALDLSAHADPSFGNFVTGANAELVAALRSLAGGSDVERFVYLWGAPGSGRSHLLAAASAANRNAQLLRAPLQAEQLDAVSPETLLALDDVDRLDVAAQRSLFRLYNRMRDTSGALIASGPLAPGGLAVRADLATRLAWGLVYQVHALSDADKSVAMSERAAAHGFKLRKEVRDYVLRHGRRDLPWLLALVDLLDRYSLETRRAVTLPLAREVIKLSLGNTQAR